jgi:hypothetical protein
MINLCKLALLMKFEISYNTLPFTRVSIPFTNPFAYCNRNY